MAIETLRPVEQDEQTPQVGARSDEMYCQSCGAVIKREAAICVTCGVATRRASYGSGAVGAGDGKSKTAAVLFAIFFGVFAWLYTYREDATKFWLTIGITVVNTILSVLTLGLWLLIALPVGLAFYAWVIVDTASKKEDWYLNY